jgi:Kef-type K+ transport system membrane component KefB
MIIFIGVPLIILLALFSTCIACCCKKKSKCSAIGKKLKDRLVWTMIIKIMVFSFLFFTFKAGIGRALNHRTERPDSNPIFLVIVILLLMAAFIFPTFVDPGLQEGGCYIQ